MGDRKIVLDANIIIRATLGSKVVGLMKKAFDKTSFYTPSMCFDEAEKHIPVICHKRGMDAEQTLATLNQLKTIIIQVPQDAYAFYEQEAKARIETRDINDWPIIACALMLDCPIWTEDNDFFGSGLPTWTSDRVHLYLLN